MYSYFCRDLDLFYSYCSADDLEHFSNESFPNNGSRSLFSNDPIFLIKEIMSFFLMFGSVIENVILLHFLVLKKDAKIIYFNIPY